MDTLNSAGLSAHMNGHWAAWYVEHWQWSQTSNCAAMVAHIFKQRGLFAPSLPQANPYDKLASHRAMRGYFTQHCTILRAPQHLAICSLGRGKLVSHVGVVINTGSQLQVLHCNEGIPTGIDDIDWLQQLYSKVEFYHVKKSC